MRNNMTIMHLYMYHHFLLAFSNLWILAFASITGFRFLGLLDFTVTLYRLFKKLTENKDFETNSLLLFTIFMVVSNILIRKKHLE